MQIEGGYADNIVPDRASAFFDLKPSPNGKNDYSQIFNQVLNQKNVKVEVLMSVPAVSFSIPKEFEFLGEGQGVKYFTELSFCKNGLVLGPDEKIKKTELEKAVDVVKYF